MYQAKFYKSINEERIAEEVRREGFDPLRIIDPPGRIYHPHRHPETKLLVFLHGSMSVKIAGEQYDCHAGDKLIISGNTEHSAVVGSEGCAFFWSEKP
jgi:quercetin dioxygenase-like cupin family protein